MIKKLKSWAKKHLIKVRVLETFMMDGVPYKIVEKTGRIPIIKHTRHLYFKKDNRIYTHSSIYVNPKHHFQPALRIPQKVIAVWSESYSLQRALVLGCAGCAIPRFIGLHYPKSKTVGVEISQKLIAIAEQYFLLDQIENRFELVQGDAIEYVRNNRCDGKQSVIYVDIFCGNTIVQDIFTESFIRAAYNSTDENGLIIINILGQSIEETIAFFNTIQVPFSHILTVRQGNATFLVLTKSQDTQKEEAFINKLKAAKNMTVFY